MLRCLVKQLRDGSFHIAGRAIAGEGSKSHLRGKHTLHVCMHAYIHAYINTCVHTYVRTYVRTYIYIYIHTSCFGIRSYECSRSKQEVTLSLLALS
jgi:hypothetical protein